VHTQLSYFTDFACAAPNEPKSAWQTQKARGSRTTKINQKVIGKRKKRQKTPCKTL